MPCHGEYLLKRGASQGQQKKKRSSAKIKISSGSDVFWPLKAITETTEKKQEPIEKIVGKIVGNHL